MDMHGKVKTKSWAQHWLRDYALLPLATLIKVHHHVWGAEVHLTAMCYVLYDKALQYWSIK